MNVSKSKGMEANSSRKYEYSKVLMQYLNKCTQLSVVTAEN